MRGVVMAATLIASGAAAQTVHLGEVERWFLTLEPLHQARACIAQDDPLRPGLEALLRDIRGDAMREIDSDYERGLLAGRLMEHAAPEAILDEARCREVLANFARGLLRLRAR